VRTKRSIETATGGDDSFLDIVANIVGILIILVLVAGVRAGRSASVPQIDPEILAALDELNQLRRSADSIQRDVLQLAHGQRQLAAQVQLTRAERDQMATMEAHLRHEYQRRREELDTVQQAALDLQTRRNEATTQLASLKRQIEQLADAPSEVVEIESLPTPISRLVDSDEQHFQIRAGRVTYIPLEALLSRLKSDAQRQISNLRSARQVESVVGPVGGFRMRYTLQRVDLSQADQVATGAGSSYARLAEWHLEPVSNLLGETLEEALRPTSEFHAVVDNFDARRVTVTLWTYPDSFTAYRKLRRELFNAGFQTAGRPLPHDIPIGGSPEGSKSAGQ